MGLWSDRIITAKAYINIFKKFAILVLSSKQYLLLSTGWNWRRYKTQLSSIHDWSGEYFDFVSFHISFFHGSTMFCFICCIIEGWCCTVPRTFMYNCNSFHASALIRLYHCWTLLYTPQHRLIGCEEFCCLTRLKLKTKTRLGKHLLFTQFKTLLCVPHLQIWATLVDSLLFDK